MVRVCGEQDQIAVKGRSVLGEFEYFDKRWFFKIDYDDDLTDKVDVPQVAEQLLAVDGLHLVAEAPDPGATLLAVHVPAKCKEESSLLELNAQFRSMDHWIADQSC